jgi:hypothetical protein
MFIATQSFVKGIAPTLIVLRILFNRENFPQSLGFIETLKFESNAIAGATEHDRESVLDVGITIASENSL